MRLSGGMILVAGFIAGAAYFWYENRQVAAANAMGAAGWQQFTANPPDPGLAPLQVNPNLIPLPGSYAQ